MKGVASSTEIVLNQIAGFECIKEYTMIGGTALSMQIGHRLSEDIDFSRWKTGKNDKVTVDFTAIEKELSQIGAFNRDVISNDQVDYIVNGVKVSFYACNLNKQPVNMKTIPVSGNLKIADKQSIGVMKLEVLLRRSTYRDYYDIYSIIKDGGDFNAMIAGALKYSDHKLRTRDILSMLSDSTRFPLASTIEHLVPKYKVSTKDIADFLKPYIQNYNKK